MVTSKAPPNRLRGTFVIASEPAFGSAPSDVIDERPFIERRENIAKSDAKTSEQNTYSRQIAFPLSSAFAIAQRARPTEGISAAFRAIQRNVFILPADSATKNRKNLFSTTYFFLAAKNSPKLACTYEKQQFKCRRKFSMVNMLSVVEVAASVTSLDEAVE